MILPSIAFEFRGTGKQLEIFVLSHFLDANRYPLRLKMPGARPALHTRRRQQGPRNSCAIRVAGRRPRFLENVEASNAASSIPGPTNQRNKRSNFSRSMQDLRACIGAWPAARSEPASPGAPGEADLPGLSANDRCTPIMIFWPGGDLRTMPALAHNEADMDWR
jgi:hypothetical protein